MCSTSYHPEHLLILNQQCFSISICISSTTALVQVNIIYGQKYWFLPCFLACLFVPYIPNLFPMRLAWLNSFSDNVDSVCFWWAIRWTNVRQPPTRRKRQGTQTLSDFPYLSLSVPAHPLSSSWSSYLHALQVFHSWSSSHLHFVTLGDCSGSIGTFIWSVLRTFYLHYISCFLLS